MPMLPSNFYTNGCSDPFLEMIDKNKTYGFTITVKELKETVPNLFRYASAYKRINNITSQGLWEMFTEDPPAAEEKKSGLPEDIQQLEIGKLPEIDRDNMEGEQYNMCHFWSNFEIARLDFFRSKAYQDFFDMLDRSGGFWSERVRYLDCNRKLSLLTTIVGRRSRSFARCWCAPWPG
jgi:mannosyltransferase